MCSCLGRSLALGVVLILASVGPARASTIDFANARWSTGNGAHSITDNGLTVAAANPVGALLSWSSGRGFGIDSHFLDDLLGTDDEVNGVELLTITLPTATSVAGFTVSNLSSKTLPGSGLLTHREVGYYRLGNGAWQSFPAPTSHTSNDGRLYVGITPTVVSTISFGYQPGLGLLDAVGNAFTVRSLDAVKGVDVMPTPEPASLLLLGTGLAALAIRARTMGRRKPR